MSHATIADESDFHGVIVESLYDIEKREKIKGFLCYNYRIPGHFGDSVVFLILHPILL